MDKLFEVVLKDPGKGKKIDSLVAPDIVGGLFRKGNMTELQRRPNTNAELMLEKQHRLFAVNYNNKTDEYGTPGGMVIVLATNAEEAKAKAELRIQKGQWVSGVQEAECIFALEKHVQVKRTA
jgi:hypothetical protein